MSSRRNLTKPVRARLSLNLAEDRNAPGSMFSPLDPLVGLMPPSTTPALVGAPVRTTPSVITISGRDDPTPPATLQAPPTDRSAARNVVSVGVPQRRTDPQAADILWDPGTKPTPIAVVTGAPPRDRQPVEVESGGDGTPRVTLTPSANGPASTPVENDVALLADPGIDTGEGFSAMSGSGSGSGSMVSLNVTYGTKLIPVNANNDNGSGWKSAALPFIPATRDFAATNLPVDDPQLVQVTVNISPGPAGTLSVSDYAPGEATVAFWADKKQAAFSSKAVNEQGGPTTVTFYVEGTHESLNSSDDVRIDLTYTAPGQTVQKSDLVKVTPVLTSFTSTIPTPSVNFDDEGPPPTGLKGLTAQTPPPGGGAWTPGITFDAELTNGPLTIKYVQSIRDVQNGANGSGAGAVFTAASGLANQNGLPKVGSGFTFPGLDSSHPADPIYGLFTSTATANGVAIHAVDSPSTGWPADADKLDKMDVKYLYRMYVVVQYSGMSLYPVAYWDWNVNFFATTNVAGKGVSVIAAASKVSVEGGWVKSNADPYKTAGPIFNGNAGWR